MIGVLALIALTQSVAQATPAVTEVRALARDAPDSVLVVLAHRRPDDLREALRALLVDAATGASAGSREASLRAARRLADANTATWNDSFLTRRVERFGSLPVPGRRATVAADSVRLAGNAALGTAGIEAAMDAWRESLRRYGRLADTAGMAAALGSVGVGFYLAARYDSAEAYLTRSRDLALRIADYRTAGNAVGNLGSVHKDRGALRRASELYAEARELRERTGDARGLAADQNNLGLVAEELGDAAGARRAYETALAANRSAGRDEPAATNLVNLGNLASLAGDYSEADRRYREALTTYRDHGNRMDAAFVLHNLGLLAMRRGDYAGAVADLVESAGIYAEIGPAADEIAVRRDLTAARAAIGDLRASRAELERAERLAAATDAGGGLLAGLALAAGDLALRFNQLEDAEEQYDRAERLARGVGDDAARAARAAAQQGMGMVFLVRERYARAERALELALLAQAGASDRRGAALTRLLLGHAKHERGDTAGARSVLRAALDTLRDLGDAGGEAAALGALGDLAVRAGLPLTADSLFRRGLARLRQRPAPGVAWRLHAGLAGALRSRGALAEAAGELRAAIEAIEAVSSGLTVEERRAAFLADKWDPYVELALVEQARGDTKTALGVSERLRARQLLDLLARGRVPASGGADGELVAREQDLRHRITELTRQLESTGVGEPGSRGVALRETEAATREALARAQGAYGGLLLEMRERRPEYAALVRGEVASADEIRSAVGADEALIEYLVGDSTTLAFVVRADTVAAVDLNVSRATLAPLVDFARGTLVRPQDGPDHGAWRAPLRRLFERLVAPLEARGLLAGARSLLIAPHAELHYLPFAALVMPGPPERPLIERYVVAYVPSASVWLRLRARPGPAGGGGVLALAPRAEALPGSRAEVEAIGRIHGDAARVLVGAAATERAFRALSPGRAVVHLATYGVLNKHNPLFSFVELAPAGADDGRLEVHEVFGLSLSAELLVLSACQTGLAAGTLADVPPGDDWVGLVRGFLFAGASHVLATLWPVEDRSTARLMERFYRERAAGSSERQALAAAQRAAARSRGTAHPFYWAGFVLVTGR